MNGAVRNVVEEDKQYRYYCRRCAVEKRISESPDSHPQCPKCGNQMAREPRNGKLIVAA